MTDVERSDHPMPDRREFVALGIGAFVVAAVPSVLRRRPGLVRREVPVMGTVAEFAVVHRDPRWAHAAIDAAIAELRRVDRGMSRFDPESDVGRANVDALRRPVAVGPETARVVAVGLRWAEASNGTFDPCLGQAMELWDLTRRREPPAAERVHAFADRRFYRSVEIDGPDDAPTLRFHEAGLALDLGGIAKGYAVDRAVDALRAWGIRRALIGVGGDLYALGHSADGDPWRVGIRSPDRPDHLIDTLPISDRAIATSGDYVRSFTHGGRRYHHLLDPASGEPRRSRVRSLTVVAETCMDADAAATAAFGLAPGAARRLVEQAGSGARIARVL